MGASLHDKQAIGANILVVSRFNGIGGALRCYDVLGILPKAVICFDTHGPANRVTSKRWPSAELQGDVRVGQCRDGGFVVQENCVVV